MPCLRLLRQEPHAGLPFWSVAPLTVAVADAQRMFAEGLVQSLQNHVGLDVHSEISTAGREIVAEVGRRKPDVVLLDFWISDMAGPAAARAILKASPLTKVLFLTEYFIGPLQAKQARSSGALWFLWKDLALNDVVTAIRAAAATPAAEVMARDDRPADRVGRLLTLTAREIEVLQVLRRSQSIRAVADQLSISAGTVKNHIHNIMVKTQAHNQVDIMMMAEEEGFISSL